MLDILESPQHQQQHHEQHDPPNNINVITLNMLSRGAESEDIEVDIESSVAWSFLEGVDVTPIGESKMDVVRVSSTESVDNHDWIDYDERDIPAQSVHRKKRRNLKRLLRGLRNFFPNIKVKGEVTNANVGENIDRCNQKKKLMDNDEMSIASTVASTAACSYDGISLSSSSQANSCDLTNDEIQVEENTNLKILLESIMLEFESSDNTADLLTDDEEVELIILSHNLEAVEAYMPQFTLDLPLMETRLLQSGLIARNEYAFVVDKVSKEVKERYMHEEERNEDENHVTHVKTGVWEVICYDSIEDGGAPQPPFYVVTGVSMDDRVDTKKLRHAIFGNSGGGTCRSTRRPLLSMAATEIAEELVGFQSGTMAPICHTTNMALYLEESIVNNVSGSLSDHRLNVGSGMFGKCLSIPLDKFLDIAAANPKGIQLSPLIQMKKKKLTQKIKIQ